MRTTCELLRMCLTFLSTCVKVPITAGAKPHRRRRIAVGNHPGRSFMEAKRPMNRVDEEGWVAAEAAI